MDWNKEFYFAEEHPLDRLVDGYSNISIFRKMAVIGDSLASGEFEVHHPNSSPEFFDVFDYSWGQFIARKNGIHVYNFSRGGMTAKEYITSFADKNNLWDREKACQAYIIALGVNDLYHTDIEMGSLQDIDDNDYRNNKVTYCGYYAQIISRYKEISPHAKFFLVTIPDDIRRDYNKQQRQCGLLYDLARHFENSYVIDLYKYGPKYDEKFQHEFFLNGHLNPMGYILSARLIDSYIDYIVRHNPMDFLYTGLINFNKNA